MMLIRRRWIWCRQKKCKLPCTYDQPDSKKSKMYAEQPLKVTEPDEMQVAVLKLKINGVIW